LSNGKATFQFRTFESLAETKQQPSLGQNLFGAIVDDTEMQTTAAPTDSLQISFSGKRLSDD
jgi:hypothetical protein